MTIQQKLSPLIENTDYQIVNGVLSALPKTRQVEQIIQHDLVPAVYSGETLISAEVPAYSETILVTETYYEIIPSPEAFAEMLIDVQLESADVALLVSEYLVGKDSLRDTENDNINIEDNRIHSWNFTNIPQPTRAELLALIPIVHSKKSETLRKKTLSELGAKSRLACQNCLDLIAGFNLQRALTAEQITSMQASFGNIQMALMTSRPTTAKALITALIPDEIIITTEMKDTILSELLEF